MLVEPMKSGFFQNENIVCQLDGGVPVIVGAIYLIII